ncbi:hypothetical protein CON70_02010 [Bacillus pseudomycoides]|uniref:polymer-forming cytoskeletal protein n=1 Tax=Bacillus pseudomycoides TaxID=64104 RepID=UPI000BEB31D8|nr:polymer-forming cytoskeletal protein [Bacillus pseudomycoides]PDZ13205.1 hypothetical protein CON70_02010 [Bacillus pseudomycoides]
MKTKIANGQDKVNVFGSKSYSQPVIAESVGIKGAASFKEDVQATKFSVVGDCVIRGSLIAKSFSNSGACKIEGVSQINEMKNTGSCKLGQIQAKHIHSSGTLSVKGDVRAEEIFTLQGAVRVHGNLQAKQIEIEFIAPSELQDVEGDRIVIGPSRKFVSLTSFIPGMKKRIACKIIKGNDITLSKTEALLVSGHHIKIGSHCNVDEVEYSGTLDVAPSASVGKITRL